MRNARIETLTYENVNENKH